MPEATPDSPDDESTTSTRSQTGAKYLSQAATKVADDAVDVIAIGAIAYMAMQGLDAATFQTMGGFVLAVAGVKRYSKLKSGK